MRASLEAQIANPLWLLGRQWQLFEFLAHDGGSAVQARLRASSSDRLAGCRVTRRRRRPGRKLDVRPAARGAGRARGSPATPQGGRASGGRGRARLPRLLEDAGLSGEYADDYLREYRIDRPTAAQRKRLGADTLRLLDVVATWAPHGGKLYADLTASLRPAGKAAPGALPRDPAIDPGDDTDTVTAIARAWLDWYDDSSPPGKLQGPLAARAAGVRVRPGRSDRRRSGAPTAPEYSGGDLDWHAFDVHPTAVLGAEAIPAAQSSAP